MRMASRIQVIVFLLIVSAAALSSGCASIVKGTTQAIPVSSAPSGADVKLDGNKVGQTPMSVDVKRKTDHLLTIERAGYQVESVAITRNIGGAVFGNILAGGLVGWGVDAVSGAQYNLTPATVSVTLKETAAGDHVTPVSQSSAAVFIEELRKLDELHVGNKISDEEYAKMRSSLVEKYSK
jgi:hypothetical protein